jgi:hypothetical protein
VDLRVLTAQRSTRFAGTSFEPLAGDRGALFLAIGGLLGRCQVEEEEAVPFGAGELAGDGAEGPIHLPLELESIHQDLHDDPPTLVLALQVGPVRWKPRVEIAGPPCA